MHAAAGTLLLLPALFLATGCSATSTWALCQDRLTPINRQQVRESSGATQAMRPPAQPSKEGSYSATTPNRSARHSAPSRTPAALEPNPDIATAPQAPR